MRIRTKGLHRIWAFSGSAAAGTYKSTDIIAVETRGEADRLNTLLETGWETAVSSGKVTQVAAAIAAASGAGAADNMITAHQRGLQLSARKEVAQILGVDDETAYLLFRLFVDIGADGVSADSRRTGVAHIPLIVSVESGEDPSTPPAQPAQAQAATEEKAPA